MSASSAAVGEITGPVAALRFKLTRAEHILGSFIDHLEEQGTGRVTTRAALELSHPAPPGQALVVALAAGGGARVCPPPAGLRSVHIDPVGLIPSPPHRALRFRRRGRPRVRHARFGRSRDLVLHPTTTKALACYARIRPLCCPSQAAPAFSVSTRGTGCTTPTSPPCSTGWLAKPTSPAPGTGTVPYARFAA